MEKIYKVEDYMDKRFLTLEPDMDVYHAIDLLLDKGMNSAVVVDDAEHVVGILSEKDCLRLIAGGSYHQLPSAKVSDFMTTEVFCIRPYTDIFKLADMFLGKHFRRIIVSDDNDILKGQITRRDLLRIIKKLRLNKEKDSKIAPIM